MLKTPYIASTKIRKRVSVDPFGLLCHFGGNLQRSRTLVQHFGFKLLSEQKQAITLLLGI